MPLPIIPIIWGLVVGIAVTIIVMLYYEQIIGWFRVRQALKQSDANNLAFSIQQRLASGNIKTVQGIFNERTNQLLDAKKYESQNVDDELARLHTNDDIVLYT